MVEVHNMYMSTDEKQPIPKAVTFEDVTKMNRKDRRRIGKINGFKFPSRTNMFPTVMEVIEPKEDTSTLNAYIEKP